MVLFSLKNVSLISKWRTPFNHFITKVDFYTAETVSIKKIDKKMLRKLKCPLNCNHWNIFSLQIANKLLDLKSQNLINVVRLQSTSLFFISSKQLISKWNLSYLNIFIVFFVYEPANNTLLHISIQNITVSSIFQGFIPSNDRNKDLSSV